LKEGRIAIFPTETCYGIGCNAFDSDAVRRIYSIKKRDESKPMLVLVSSISMWKKIAYVTKEAEKIALENWPCALTIIQKKKKIIPDILAKDRIGVRISSNKTANEIVSICEFPVVATSANLSGEPSNYSVSSMPEELKKKVDYILDAGTLPLNKPSKIIDVKNGKIKEIRN